MKASLIHTGALACLVLVAAACDGPSGGTGGGAGGGGAGVGGSGAVGGGGAGGAGGTTVTSTSTETVVGPPPDMYVFPPSYVGFEGSTVPVRVKVTDDAGIVSVNVGGVEAALGDDGYWLALEVPVSEDVVIEVVNGAGQIFTAPHPLVASALFVDELSFLSAAPDGRVVGYDFRRQAVMEYDPFASPQHKILSGPTVGQGAPLVDPGDHPIGLTWLDGTIYFGAAISGALKVVAIAPASGDRTVLPPCFAPAPQAPEPHVFAAAGMPLRFFTAVYHDVSVCGPGGGAGQLVATTPFWPGRLLHDAGLDRVVVAGEDYGAPSYGQILAIDPSDGSTSVVLPGVTQPGSRIESITLVDGSYYYITAGGELRRLVGGAPPEVLASQIFNNLDSLASCPAGNVPALCYSRTYGTARITESPGGWVNASVPIDNAIGSGPVGEGWHVVAVPDEPMPDLIYGLPVVRMDGETGARHHASPSKFTSVRNIRSLPSGTVVDLPASAFRMFNAFAASVVLSDVPGPSVSGVFQFDLAPAGTWLANEAIVYATASAIRLRDIVTGTDQQIVPFTQTNGLVTDENGVVYVGNNAGQLFKLAPGSGAAQLLVSAPGFPNVGLSYDPRGPSLVAGALATMQLDTLAITTFDTSSFEFPVSAPDRKVPGPFSGTYFVMPNGRDVMLLDLVGQKTFVLAR